MEWKLVDCLKWKDGSEILLRFCWCGGAHSKILEVIISSGVIIGNLNFFFVIIFNNISVITYIVCVVYLYKT